MDENNEKQNGWGYFIRIFHSFLYYYLILTYICKNHYFHCLAKCVLYIYLKKSLELLIFKEFVKLRYEAMFLPLTYYNQSWGELA